MKKIGQTITFLVMFGLIITPIVLALVNPASLHQKTAISAILDTWFLFSLIMQACLSGIAILKWVEKQN